MLERDQFVPQCIDTTNNINSGCAFSYDNSHQISGVQSHCWRHNPLVCRQCYWEPAEGTGIAGTNEVNLFIISRVVLGTPGSRVRIRKEAERSIIPPFPISCIVQMPDEDRGDEIKSSVTHCVWNNLTDAVLDKTTGRVRTETDNFRVCKSVHHHTFNWINQPDAATSQVYYLSFKYSSTCFGHPHAHHQELQQLQ